MVRLTHMLNILLVAFAGVFCYEIFQVWSGLGDASSPPAVKEVGMAPTQEGTTPSARSQPKDSYHVIVDKNPFRPQRTDWEGQEVRVQRPQLVLSGVTLAGEYKSALLATRGGRGAKLYRLGEQVGGYTIKQIEADRVLLAMGDDSFSVMLHDPNKPKREGQAPKAGAPPGTPKPPFSFPFPTGTVEKPPVEGQPQLQQRERRRQPVERLRRTPGLPIAPSNLSGNE
jgi:hypothetical protein